MTPSKIAPGAFVAFISVHIFLLVAIMAAGRLSMVTIFAEPGSLEGRGRELLAMWRVGTMFDLRTATIGLLPLYALSLVSCFYGSARKICSAVQLVWSPFLYLMVTLGTIINFFYYRTFHNEIDIAAFGLVNDGTQAVLTAMLKNYPSIRVFLLLIFITTLFAWLTRGIWRSCLSWKPPKGFLRVSLGAVFVLAFTAVYIVGVRGTLRPTPLRQHDRMVSNFPLLNKAVPNGWMAFSWAYSNYKNTPPYVPVTQEEGRKLALAAIGRDELHETTAENDWLKKNPPHVVMLIMEAFGTNLLVYDKPGTTDLLGSFRPHLEHDFLFKRFISEENFTMPALARLLFSCPDESISRSTFKSKRLGDTPFDTFSRNGYETVFIYPGHGSWHDIRAYMSLHDVGRTYFLSDFFEKYGAEKPHIISEASARGIADEYIFPLVHELLENATKPMFIVVLTLTNHLPDVPPPSYTDRYPINPNAELLDKLNAQKSVKRDMLSTYQYGNNCVGDFVTAIKGGPHGDNTVIAAFGDHRVISVKAKYPDDLFLNRAVPFYIYVPKPILEHTPHRYSPERIGSIKDVLPTLYSLSLSGAQYYSVGGRNLLAEQDDAPRAFGYNSRLFIDADGACALGDDFTGSWYTFDKDMNINNIVAPMLGTKAEKIRAYEQLYRWQINARVAGVIVN